MNLPGFLELVGSILIEKQITNKIVARVGPILLKTMNNKMCSLVGSILLETSSKSKSITV